MFSQLIDTKELVGLPEAIEEVLEGCGHATCMAFNPYGTLIATGCQDGDIIIWDYQTRGPSRTIKAAHTTTVTAIVWSASGRRLTSVSLDGTLAVWDVISPAQLLKQDLGRGPILHMSPPGSGGVEKTQYKSGEVNKAAAAVAATAGINEREDVGQQERVVVSFEKGSPEVLRFEKAVLKDRLPLPTVWLEGDGRALRVGMSDGTTTTSTAAAAAAVDPAAGTNAEGSGAGTVTNKEKDGNGRIKRVRIDADPQEQKEVPRGTEPGKERKKIPAAAALAEFSPNGEVVAVATHGLLSLLRYPSMEFLDIVRVVGNPVARSMQFAPHGQQLLLTAGDKKVRVYDIIGSSSLGTNRSEDTVGMGGKKVLAGIPGKTFAQLKLTVSTKAPKEGSLMYPGGVSGSVLVQSRKFESNVERLHWRCAAFSPDGEHVATAVDSSTEHIIYNWNVHYGFSENTLQGGGSEGLVALIWHPTPLPMQLLALSTSGKVYIWAKIFTQEWRAFGPDFEDLRENREHVEAETEFDYNPKQGDAGTGSDNDADEEDVDVLTRVKDFSEFNPANVLLPNGEQPLYHLPVIVPELEADSERTQSLEAEAPAGADADAEGGLPTAAAPPAAAAAAADGGTGSKGDKDTDKEKSDAQGSGLLEKEGEKEEEQGVRQGDEKIERSGKPPGAAEGVGTAAAAVVAAAGDANANEVQAMEEDSPVDQEGGGNGSEEEQGKRMEVDE